MTTPGAGEGERWELRGLYTGYAIIVCLTRGVYQKTVATNVKLADADLICTLHNERTHLVSRDAYVEMRDAHEADQQTIAELRKALGRTVTALEVLAARGGTEINTRSVASQALAIAATEEPHD